MASSRTERDDVVPLPLTTFDEFFRTEYRRVVGLAAVLTGRQAVAEELAQDAFVAAFRNWEHIGQYDDPGQWVRRVVTNSATSALRRTAREARMLARLALRRPPETEALPVDDALWSAVRALPRRQVQCITLFYLEDRSADDIGAILGIAAATVRVHLHSARSALANTFGEALDEETP